MRLEFQAQLAVRHLAAEFSLEDGETLAILGPNGSGKSSVLDMIAGLLQPDHGRIQLGGRLLTATGSHGNVRVPPHRRRVALLAQEPLLFPHLNARDNVAFGPRSAGVPRTSAREQAELLLADLGAADLGSIRPAQLSGGQAQRVALARALAVEPDLLLLDEPMAALDVNVVPALRQTLRRVLAGRSTVMVTHDVLDALLLADRVVVLDRGQVAEAGPAAQVLSRPRSVFGARIAGLNMMHGLWRDGAVHAAGHRVRGLVDDASPSPGALAIAVFRPQAVAVHAPGRVPPGGPRNSFDVILTDLHPVGDLMRVRAGGLTADVTPQAAAELDLRPGEEVTFAIKTTEVTIYAA